MKTGGAAEVDVANLPSGAMLEPDSCGQSSGPDGPVSAAVVPTVTRLEGTGLRPQSFTESPPQTSVAPIVPSSPTRKVTVQRPPQPLTGPLPTPSVAPDAPATPTAISKVVRSQSPPVIPGTPTASTGGASGLLVQHPGASLSTGGAADAALSSPVAASAVPTGDAAAPLLTPAHKRRYVVDMDLDSASESDTDVAPTPSAAVINIVEPFPRRSPPPARARRFAALLAPTALSTPPPRTRSNGGSAPALGDERSSRAWTVEELAELYHGQWVCKEGYPKCSSRFEGRRTRAEIEKQCRKLRNGPQSTLKALRDYGAAKKRGCAVDSDACARAAAAVVLPVASPTQYASDEVVVVIDDSSGVDDSVTCRVCLRASDEDKMLLCDECDRGYHLYCLTPKLATIPKGDVAWYCSDCIKNDRAAAAEPPRSTRYGEKSKGKRPAQYKTTAHYSLWTAAEDILLTNMMQLPAEERSALPGRTVQASNKRWSSRRIRHAGKSEPPSPADGCLPKSEPRTYGTKRRYSSGNRGSDMGFRNDAAGAALAASAKGEPWEQLVAAVRPSKRLRDMVTDELRSALARLPKAAHAMQTQLDRQWQAKLEQQKAAFDAQVKELVAQKRDMESARQPLMDACDAMKTVLSTMSTP